MSVLNNICNICYSNETHHKLKCETCNHNVCNDCFSDRHEHALSVTDS